MIIWQGVWQLGKQFFVLSTETNDQTVKFGSHPYFQTTKSGLAPFFQTQNHLAGSHMPNPDNQRSNRFQSSKVAIIENGGASNYFLHCWTYTLEGKNANLTYSGKPNAINLSFGDDLYTLFMVILRVVYGIGSTTLFLSSDY